MEAQAVDTPDSDAPPYNSDRWRDFALIMSLLILAGGLRLWLLLHTEVPARDTIGYIRYALAFEIDPWTKVLRDNHQHPGYPLTILAVSLPARSFLSLPETEMMVVSSQIASGLAAVLLVIPMYFLGKLLFHRAAGFGAALCFQFLPVPAHILSDGLSEALFLLLMASGLAWGVLAIQKNKPWQFALCGIFSGLAYLTRPEGILLSVAMLVVLAGMQLAKERRSLRQLMNCAGSLMLWTILVGSPYVYATKSFSNKPSLQQMMGAELSAQKSAAAVPTQNAPVPLARGTDWVSGGPLLACTFAITLNLRDSVSERLYKSLWGMAGELAKCFHYVAVAPILLGLWWFRRQHRVAPGMWVVFVLCALFAMAVWRLAVQVGYFSDRHLLLLAMCGCYAGAAALWELASLATSSSLFARMPKGEIRTTFFAVILLGVCLSPGLSKTFETLHANRAGYHAAGIWLAEHAVPSDHIEDDHCWAHYYAGHVFRERHSPAASIATNRTHFVVLGRREREINLTWNRQPPPNEDKLRSQGGQIVFHWPASSSPAQAPIVIYALTVATGPVGTE